MLVAGPTLQEMNGSNMTITRKLYHRIRMSITFRIPTTREVYFLYLKPRVVVGKKVKQIKKLKRPSSKV